MSTARIAVIGTGYVGLTSAACFAAMGHEVVCADVDAAKVAELSRGQVPILEAGLDELVAEGIANGRLTFVTDNLAAVRGARFVFLCLPTPEGGDGRADLRIVHQVVAELASQLDPGTVLVTKSTVPVGTAESLTKTIARGDVAIVSNPEFLQEGTAVRNFMQPDRVVVGSADAQAARDVADLYESLNAPAIVTSAESAELIKYASNSFLAVKLSFVNSVAALAAEVGADITDIAAGMGLDPRIGDKFLRAGPGWGGSCFPKDVKALAVIAEDAAVPFPLLTTAVDTNDAVQRRVVALIAAAAGGSLQGVTVGLWGLTFKAGTDDLRESPALQVARLLHEAGAQLRAYDPAVAPHRVASGPYPPMTVVGSEYEAAAGADVIVLLTEWPQFATLDFAKVAGVAGGRVVVDTRLILDEQTLADAGLSLVSWGRRGSSTRDQ